MFKVYSYVQDGGDGSASIQWTNDPDYLEKHDDDEGLYMNEGDFSDVLTFESEEAAKAVGLSWNNDLNNPEEDDE